MESTVGWPVLRSAAEVDCAPRGGEKGAEQVVEVRVASVDEAERITLYLHPDDHRALASARVDDGITANARLRVMIALWRSDDQIRDRVNQLANSR